MTTIEGMTRAVATVPKTLRRREMTARDFGRTPGEGARDGHEPPIGAIAEFTLEFTAKFLHATATAMHHVFKKNSQSPVKPQ